MSVCAIGRVKQDYSFKMSYFDTTDFPETLLSLYMELLFGFKKIKKNIWGIIKLKSNYV